MAQLNAGLAGLTYRSPQDYYGQDFIAVYVNDMGNIGSGGPKWVNETIPIRVHPVADPPRIRLPVDMVEVIQVERKASIFSNADTLPDAHSIHFLSPK